MRRSHLLIAFITVSFAFVSAPLSAAGQGGTVRGRVADSTGVPIAGAVVVLDPGGQRAVSRDNGEYVISRVPPGTYTLVAWHERLGELSRQVAVVDDKPVSATFEYAKP